MSTQQLNDKTRQKTVMITEDQYHWLTEEATHINFSAFVRNQIRDYREKIEELDG